MKVLVCGGRDYRDVEHVILCLSELATSGEVTQVIQGGSRGADECARVAATWLGIECVTFHAEWDRYGKSAGPRRNRRMLLEGKPDVVLAFPGGRGTADMVSRARWAGVRVVERS